MVALDGVDLTLHAGVVHALTGENGSGKSTLARVASGALLPDAGRIEVDGAERAIGSPRQALELGIVTITQELMLAPTLRRRRFRVGASISSCVIVTMPALRAPAAASRSRARRRRPAMRPALGEERAGGDARERRLPRAVLARQRMHDAGVEREVDAVQGDHAGEAPGDPGEAEVAARRSAGHHAFEPVRERRAALAAVVANAP